jgi:hypothetical protein
MSFHARYDFNYTRHFTKDDIGFMGMIELRRQIGVLGQQLDISSKGRCARRVMEAEECPGGLMSEYIYGRLCHNSKALC